MLTLKKRTTIDSRLVFLPVLFLGGYVVSLAVLSRLSPIQLPSFGVSDGTDSPSTAQTTPAVATMPVSQAAPMSVSPVTTSSGTQTKRVSVQTTTDPTASGAASTPPSSTVATTMQPAGGLGGGTVSDPSTTTPATPTGADPTSPAPASGTGTTDPATGTDTGIGTGTGTSPTPTDPPTTGSGTGTTDPSNPDVTLPVVGPVPDPLSATNLSVGVTVTTGQ